MLPVNIAKMKDLVYKEIISPAKIKWKTDAYGNLYSISMHSEQTSFDIFWFDINDNHYSVLYDNRKQRIYIKDETHKPEIRDYMINNLRTLKDVIYSTYHTCIKVTDDWERIDN